VHALRFGDAVYDVANALRELELAGEQSGTRSRRSGSTRPRSAARFGIFGVSFPFALSFLFLARWRHHAQVCQCPGSKRVNFTSAPFASLFRTELEISESARAAIPKCAFESALEDEGARNNRSRVEGE